MFQRSLLCILTVSTLVTACKTAKEKPEPASASNTSKTPGASSKDTPEPRTSTAAAAPSTSEAPSANAEDPSFAAVFGPRGPLHLAGYTLRFADRIDHATTAGFSSDGKYFGYCEPNGGKGGECCTAIDTAKKMSTIELDEPSSKGALADWQARFKAWLPVNKGKSNSPPAIVADVAFSRDFTFVASSGTVKCDAAGNCTGGYTLSGKYKNERPVVVMQLSLHVDQLGALSELHADIIAVSPDGNEIGIVAHAFCGEYCEPKTLDRVNLAEAVGHILNDEGYDHHKKKEFDVAADLWSKAHLANPKAEMHAYNLACAYAQLHKADKSEKALKEAIDLGGKAVAARAKKDTDFGEYKDAEWFKKLTD